MVAAVEETGIAGAPNVPRRRWRLPMVAVLALSFTSLTFVAVVGALALGLQNAAQTTQALLRERAADALDSTVERLFNYMQPLVSQVAGVAELVRSGAVEAGRVEAITPILVGALATAPQVASITLVDPGCRAAVIERGMQRLQPVAVAEGALCASVAWARGAEGQRWKAPFWSNALGQAVIAVEQPLHGPGGFAGLLISAVGVGELSGFLQSIAPGGGQTPFILYGRDTVVAHPRKPVMSGTLSAARPLPRIDGIGDSALARLWDPAAVPLPPGEIGPDSSGHRVEVGGQAVNLVFRTVDAGTEEPWYVGTHYVGSLGEAEIRRLYITGLFGLGILAGAVLLTLIVGSRLTRPVRNLAAAAVGIEHQRFDAFRPLPPSRIAELDGAARAFNHMVTGLQERQRIRDLFGRYVPPAVVEQILADPGSVEIGGEKRAVTILFSDVAGFTTFSEQVTPEIVVEVLNAYFAEISRLVVEQGGIVVDYIGDAVFAMFGAPIALPGHAAAGLAAARAMGRFTRDFAAAQQARGVPFGATRIGVHTGTCTVGNFGSADRLKYSAHGDMVNTASRLEGANKAFGTTILASIDTVREAGDRQTRPVARVVLKGRAAALELHEVLIAEPPAWMADYRAAYGLLDDEDPGSAEAFGALAARAPEDPVIALHARRLRAGGPTSQLELLEK